MENPHCENFDRGRPQTNPPAGFAEPRQVFAYENTGGGRLVLTEVKAEAAEPFPPGSLAKYVTPERDAEMLELLKGCSLELPG